LTINRYNAKIRTVLSSAPHLKENNVAMGIRLTFGPSERKKLDANWMAVQMKCLYALERTIVELGGVSAEPGHTKVYGRPYVVSMECRRTTRHPSYKKMEAPLRAEIEKALGVTDFTMKEAGTQFPHWS
jgi:hypothetical protein